MSGRSATPQTPPSITLIYLVLLRHLVACTTRQNTLRTKRWLVLFETVREDDRSNAEVQIVDFLNDFSNASSRAQQLDNKILQNATSVSGGLGDLVSLATAQVYGSMQLTIGTDAHGNLNESDVMMFMKNIGGVNAK